MTLYSGTPAPTMPRMADPTTRARASSKHDADIELHRQKYAFRRYIVLSIAVICGILVSSVPLYFVYLIFKEIAGKTTSVSIALTITGSFVVGGSLFSAIGTWVRGRAQRKELLRLRKRCEDYEKAHGL